MPDFRVFFFLFKTFFLWILKFTFRSFTHKQEYSTCYSLWLIFLLNDVPWHSVLVCVGFPNCTAVYSFFIYFFSEGHTNGLPFFIITNILANILVHIFVCVCVSVSEGCSPRNGISRPKDMHISIFAKLYRGSLLKFCFNLSIKKKIDSIICSKRCHFKFHLSDLPVALWVFSHAYWLFGFFWTFILNYTNTEKVHKS